MAHLDFKNYERLWDLIRESLINKKFDDTATHLADLNVIRLANNLNTYSPSDILFLNFDCIGNTTEYKPTYKSVYIAKFEDETIKIGVSQNPTERIHSIAHMKGFGASNILETVPIENAFEIEALLHKSFSKNRLLGEYFNCSFEEVVTKVNELGLDYKIFQTV